MLETQSTTPNHETNSDQRDHIDQGTTEPIVNDDVDKLQIIHTNSGTRDSSQPCSTIEPMLESKEVLVGKEGLDKVSLPAIQVTEAPATEDQHHDQDHTLLLKDGPSVKFMSGSYTRSLNDETHSREFLSSPTASRITFGFGSLDIIMENDKERRQETDGSNSDPYERPQSWGWVVVIASWVVMIPIAGVLASFGTIVSSLTQEFNATKFESGWIGSLAFSFTVGTCPLSTILFTVYGARKVAFVGIFGATVSLVGTSFAPTINLFYFTYSAMLGVFANFVYNTGMNLTGQYFPKKHQALATCLASAGISFGTLLVNPLSSHLVASLGWRNTMRILAGLVLVVGIGCVSTFKPVKTRDQKIQTKIRHKTGRGKEKDLCSDPALRNVDIEAVTESLQAMHTESKISLAAQEIKKSVFNKQVWNCSICTNPAFLLWMLGTLLWSISFLFPFIFLIDYMTTIGIVRERSAWVMTAYGIAEFSGRFLCAFGAGKINFSLAYVYAGSCAFVGAATLLAPLGKTLAMMYAYAIVAGINSGILNSLMFVATMQFFGNETGTHAWGYINVMLATGMIIGPVVAGAMYDATHSYVSAFYMGGSVFLLCAVVMCLIPIAISRFPQHEPEAQVVRQKVPARTTNGKSNVSGKTGSIVKPGSLLKLAQHQAALKASDKSSKSKWNGDVHAHLQELDDIEEEFKQGGQQVGVNVKVTLSQEETKEETPLV